MAYIIGRAKGSSGGGGGAPSGPAGGALAGTYPNPTLATQGLLAVVQNVTGGTKATTSATQADVDATNSKITFTAPVSGKVLVRVSATTSLSGGVQNARFGMREGSTDVAGPTDIAIGFAGSSFAVVSWTAYITGITAGSHTYKLAFSVTGSVTFSVFQGSSDPVILEVWGAP